ncbi:MAG TPA: FGGY-family carbohydrate kinase [Candidatus Binatia bacterium]|nr:FGGY-family carbohydrate kinase [Candidatus Binatia bacterium]
MSLLAIDMGSSSCKAIAYALDGQVLAETSHPYISSTPMPSRSELSANVFWQAFRQVTSKLSRDTASDAIEAIGISSHGETFVAVDERNQPISPAILNMDDRAVTHADRLKQIFDPKRIFDITGLTIHLMYPLPKILWMREHQPDVFSSTRRFLPVTSYLLAQLGVQPCVDYSLASRFLAFDVRRKEWSGEILDACELDHDLFPTAVPTGTVAGQLVPGIAQDLGVPVGTPVVVGGHDQPCAALGMGAIEPGRVSASLGTYECLLAPSKEPAINEDAYAANLNTYCHVVPDRYVTLAYFPAGIMLEWFLGLIRDERHAPDTIDRVCSAWESRAPAGPGGLLIAPHLLGTCNPDFDPRASGVIAGLRPATTASDIYKGILEGIACEFAAMARLLQRVAGNFSDVYVTGGGCRSKLGMRLRAALSGCRLHRTSSSDAVCLGTAILAGLGAGKYKSISQTVERLVKVIDTDEPDSNLATTYRDFTKRYQNLYRSLAGLRAPS